MCALCSRSAFVVRFVGGALSVGCAEQILLPVRCGYVDVAIRSK
jgi:hypothetical protein